jgi:hypothetical protein
VATVPVGAVVVAQPPFIVAGIKAAAVVALVFSALELVELALHRMRIPGAVAALADKLVRAVSTRHKTLVEQGRAEILGVGVVVVTWEVIPLQGAAALAQCELSGPASLANSHPLTLVHLNFLEINHVGKN